MAMGLKLDLIHSIVMDKNQLTSIVEEGRPDLPPRDGQQKSRLINYFSQISKPPRYSSMDYDGDSSVEQSQGLPLIQSSKVSTIDSRRIMGNKSQLTLTSPDYAVLKITDND